MKLALIWCAVFGIVGCAYVATKPKATEPSKERTGITRLAYLAGLTS